MSRTRSQTALLFTAPVTLLILTAASAVYVQPRPRQAANPEPEIVLKQLQDRLSRGQPWDDVRVGVSCFNNSGHRAVTIFGRGIGIWNQRAQFFLDPERVHSVLELLRKGEFLKMKESYGGPPNQTSGPLAVSVTCRIDLSVSRLRKSSMQRRKGEQSAKLKQLANQILDLCEGPARSAVGIDSLSAGLQKLRDGSLAPETFSLLYHRKPERLREKEKTRGWLLRIQGLEVEVQNYVPGQGYSEPRSRQLTRDEFARLIESLDKFEIEGLPANLYAKDYTDVRLEVLSRKKDVQARAFSGMTPQTHGAKQQQFERLTGLLTQLTSDISPPASREPR